MKNNNEYKRRQKLMHDAGFATKTDGSWGSWHENLWLNYLKDKYPVTTFIGDKIALPIANGLGNLLSTVAESGRPLHNAIKNKEYHRIPLTLFNTTMGIGMSPLSSTIGLFPASKYLGYLDPVHTRALFSADKLINDPNYKYLELDYSDVNPFLNDAVTTASYLKAGQIGHNYSLLGRYTLNHLYPASYPFQKIFKSGTEGKIARSLIKTLASLPFRPIFLKLPLFTNGKRPVWYDHYKQASGELSAEGRFLTGEKWAGIEDVPTSRMYTLNEDGKTYSLTPEFLREKSYVGLDPKESVPIEGTNKKKVIMGDHITKGQIGGEHSDFIVDLNTERINYQGNKEYKGYYQDRLALNPLWIISTYIKDKLPKDKNAFTKRVEKVVDFLGGVNASGLVGYKPFTIKFPVDYIFENFDGDATIRPSIYNKLSIVTKPKKSFNTDFILDAEWEEIK